MQLPLADDLPEVGLIAPGVGCGFMIWTDTSVAILDFFITNLEVPAITRGRAINEIIDGLLMRAKLIGFTRVKCDSQIITIQKKAKSLGFIEHGSFQVFTKEI